MKEVNEGLHRLELKSPQRKQKCIVWLRVLDPFEEAPPVLPFLGLQDIRQAPREAWIDTPRLVLQTVQAKMGDSFRLCIDGGRSISYRVEQILIFRNINV